MTNLIRTADEFEDVDLGMWLTVIGQERVQVWDWRKRAVFIGNAV